MTTITQLFGDAKMDIRGIAGLTHYFNNLDIAGSAYRGKLIVQRVRRLDYAWRGELVAETGDAIRGECWTFEAHEDSAGLVLDELKAGLLAWARSKETEADL